MTVSSQRYRQPRFSLQLPAGWQVDRHDSEPYDVYHLAPSSGQRSLDIYVDQLPASLAVNHMLVLRPSGDHFVRGQLSPKCTSQGGSLTGYDGASFNCSLAGSGDQVIGTSSPGQASRSKLGDISVLFVYDDARPTPDPADFYAIVDSFQAE